MDFSHPFEVSFRCCVRPVLADELDDRLGRGRIKIWLWVQRVKRDVYWPTDATEHKGNPVVPFSHHRPSAK